jgi:hypothetical protein
MRYNTKAKKTVETVTNHQGGTGVKYDPKLELVAILSTGFDNTYYEMIKKAEVDPKAILTEIEAIVI